MSYYDDDKDPLATLAAVIVGSVLLLALVLSAIGCSSATLCPECIPEVVYEEIVLPVRVCEPPATVDTLYLPGWPTLPDNATTDQIKSWYAECAAVLEAREALLHNRIKLLSDMLDTYKE